ncbi:MAG TPA: NAD-dependent deacetylase [Desulfuromonadales bacterium]|nr:NAD-dependent deacetylase [Desulfuromonadales bacterium]
MFTQAAAIIRDAEAFVITAGAGMGVDSGLPDFRGDQGFWNAYPAYARLGLSFAECANPQHFASDPRFGWGFYGHRTNLYRATVPHAGFHIIRRWIEHNGADYFVVTSNVDGQFQKAGYAEEHICEVHGSIHYLQCQTACNGRIWPNNASIEIDGAGMRAISPLPHCPECGKVTRPNILMFGDWNWLAERTRAQEERFERFLSDNKERRIAVIEIGAGSAIPTIRATSERIGWDLEHATVIRINPREAEIRPPHLAMPCGALEGLQKTQEALARIENH